MSTHHLCFEQKYEKYQKFLSENFHSLVGKFSVYLNRQWVLPKSGLKFIRGMILILNVEHSSR